ncbi:MAG: InlB B-repeat-containing protein [Clostridia bacterium]|nr:InlB B-repeat-containing protein [Clostridia bacterium]
MKTKRISLIAILSVILLVCSVLFVGSLPKKVSAGALENEVRVYNGTDMSDGKNTFQLANAFTTSPKSMETMVRLKGSKNGLGNCGVAIGACWLAEDGDKAFNVGFSASRQPQLWWNNGEIYWTTNYNLVSWAWVHVMFVRDTENTSVNPNGLIYCYVDGQLVDTYGDDLVNEAKGAGTEIPTPTGKHFIGRDARDGVTYPSTGTSFLMGYLNYVGISSSIYSKTQVEKAFFERKRVITSDDSGAMLTQDLSVATKTYYRSNAPLQKTPNTFATTVNIPVGTSRAYAKDANNLGQIFGAKNAGYSYDAVSMIISNRGFVRMIWDPGFYGTDMVDVEFETPVSGYTGSLDIRTGKDIHIAVVRKSTSGIFELYLNGVLASTSAYNENLKKDVVPRYPIGIGKDLNTSGHSNAAELDFPGKIYDLSIYSNELSANDIKNIYNTSDKTNITNSNYSSLLANWVLDSNQSSLIYNINYKHDVKDYSNNHNDAHLCTVGDYYVPETPDWFKTNNDEYTLIYVPDTQCTVRSYYPYALQMFDWIVDNAYAMNLQFVMGLGDIVDGIPDVANTGSIPHELNVADQWDKMAEAYKKLSDNGILWSAIVGNHDYDLNSLGELPSKKASVFNEHFGYNSTTLSNDVRATVVGRYHTDTASTQENDMLNVIYEYTATTNNGAVVKYLVLAFEFGPSPEVIEWALEFISKPEYANHRVLYNTHSLVFADGQFGNSTTTNNPEDYWRNGVTSVNGEQTWEMLLSKSANVFINASGHIESDSIVTRTDIGDYGNKVMSMLADAQGIKYHGSYDSIAVNWGDPILLVCKVNEKNQTIKFNYFNAVNGMFYGVENEFVYDFSDWKADPCTVTWKNHDGSVIETDENVSWGSVPEYNGETPVKSGYTFMGWATTLDGTPVDQSNLSKLSGDVTYYAIFVSNDEICNITWVVDGKTTTVVVKKGTMPEYNGVPYKYGYEFIGWDKTIVTATADATYTAKFTDTSVWDGTYPNVSSYKFNGQGTKTSPWLIESAKDFAALSKITYGQNHGTSSQYYKLTINLDLTAGNFQSICSDVEYSDNKWTVWYLFGANFDGDNHTIKLNVNTDKFAYGLFGGLSGSISNLILDGTVNVSSEYVGALVSRVFNGAKITNVINKANVTGSGQQVGGLVGNANNEAVVTITNCSNQGNVSSNSDFVAGILGGGWASVKLDNCSNSGNITGNVNVAGIIGELWLQGSVANCSNTGIVTGGSTIANAKIGNYNSNLVGTIIGKDNVNTYYTITWVVDGVSTLEYYASGEVPSYNGTPAKAKDAQYTYTFSGWDKTIVAVTGDTTYTAKFSTTLNKYTITWVIDGVESTEEYNYGETPEYKGTPTKDSDSEYTYTFTNWDKTVVTVTSDATYTAIFQATKIQTSSSSSSSSSSKETSTSSPISSTSQDLSSSSTSVSASSSKPLSSSTTNNESSSNTNNKKSGCGGNISNNMLLLLPLIIVVVGFTFIKKRFKD